MTRGAFQPKMIVLASAALILSLPSLFASGSEPTLTFPHIASGEGIEMEINLVNIGEQTEPVEIFFFDDAGEPMALQMESGKAKTLKFSMSGKSTRRIPFNANTDLKIGYATVVSDSLVSNLVGNVIFTVNRAFDVSVPDSQPSTQARVFVEKSGQLGSGIAILNPGEMALEVTLSLLNGTGEEVISTTVSVDSGTKKTGFLPDLFPQHFADGKSFLGTLRASADAPFHLLGLRQRASGSLATLPVSTGSSACAGSQLLFLLDSGIDMLNRGFTNGELASRSVTDLTGITKATRPNWLKITNNNRKQAVTLHFYYLNDQCRNSLDFLVVLPCGETLNFDPFEFAVPLTDLSTSNLLFGYGLPTEFRWSLPAADFGSGRFILSVVACGVSLDENNTPEILYPNEMAMIGVCGITTQNAGSDEGFKRENLHVYNARPMVFDFLTGAHWSLGSSCTGPMVPASEEIKAKSTFTRTLVPLAGVKNSNFLTLAKPDTTELLEVLTTQGESRCGDVALPATVTVTWGAEPLTILSN